MSETTPVLGRLPGRYVVHVLRRVHGVYIPACTNSFATRNPADVDRDAQTPTCRRCQKK